MMLEYVEEMKAAGFPIPFNDFKSLSSRLSENGYSRTAKQCRERLFGHLVEGISKAPFSNVEDRQLWELVQHHGRKWAFIRLNHMPHRSENTLKNHYNSQTFQKKAADWLATIEC